MSAAVEIEPARYALTGAGMNCLSLRTDIWPFAAIAGEVGALDAPDWIPVGSVHSDPDFSLMFTTRMREGADA